MSQQEPKLELSRAIRQEYAVKILLILLFIAVVALASLAGTGKLMQRLASWSAIDFLLVGLATHRLGRLVAYDRVMEPVRRPFARTGPDATGAGESVEPIGEGLKQVIGQLLTCPICSGTWIAAGLVIGLVWLPEVTRLFLWMTAAIGLAEIINALVEMFSWSGQLNRTLTGQSRLKQILKDNKHGSPETGNTEY